MCDLEYGYMGFTRNIIKIKGQTYQNLSNNIEYKGSGSWVNIYNISENGTYTFKSDNKHAFITLYDKEAIKLLRENSVYTLVFDIDTDFVNYKGICINGNVDGYFDQSMNIYLRDSNTTLTNGSYKFKFTMGSVTNMFAIGFRNTSSITSGTYFRAYNFKLLEGDYTNTDLPSSINGIESACENENNVLLLKDNSITLPQPLRSLPNGVCDEVVGNKLIQNIYELKFDSSFNFNNSIRMGNGPTDTSLCRFDIYLPINTVIGNVNSVISNIFPYLFIHHLTGGSISVTQECISNHSEDKTKVNVIIKKSRLASVTVDGFKEWCITNNFKILYTLETPIEHTIDVNIKKIKKSKCYNKIKPTII